MSTSMPRAAGDTEARAGSRRHRPLAGYAALTAAWGTAFAGSLLALRARAPFAEHQEAAGHGEVEERARGRGLRLAIGELVTCPYCLGQWVVSGSTLGMVGAPRLTRLLAAMWSAEAVADAAQLAYGAAERRA